ncbi:class I SAM-dependent methyltransferase [Pseudofulvibacter geojedonensis]|uniref:Class I SAM-dependent methyltransferase n=1 Tax=Pseudofulvibacter geojedonensis TaxID=1123758 RepID=A0ABW3I3J7_9FLAO
MKTNWNKHIDELSKQMLPPSATLQWVLNYFEKTEQKADYAIDLGCGSGVDTFAMLSAGLQVLAIDKEISAIKHIKQKIEQTPFKTQLELLDKSFEEVKLPNCKLLNASFSLPFCKPTHFKGFWSEIVSAIKPNGWFSGHFFGKEDGWYPNNEITFLSTAEIRALFSDFEIKVFEEVNKVGKTINNKEKQWHVYHVVAQKKETK